MDGDAPSSSNETHDLVPGKWIAAPCKPDHHIVNPLDEEGISGSVGDLLEKLFQDTFSLPFRCLPSTVFLATFPRI
jgi:hypothetical protein